MAVAGWILDKSAGTRLNADPSLMAQLDGMLGNLFLCPVSQLEHLYSARSAEEYDRMRTDILEGYGTVDAPADILERTLRLQRDLAHHHGMWHRIPIPDLIIAETAAHHGLGVLHVDSDFERIAEVNGITVRRLSV